LSLFAKPGDTVTTGDILGTVQETPLIVHRIMVPNVVAGELIDIDGGEHTVVDPIAKVKKADGTG
jgi:V/A-type H+-transporting ATPase subunit A